MTTENNNLPALNNEDIRKLNSQKVIDCIDEIKDNMKASKQAAKVTTIYLIGVVIFIGFILITSIAIVAYKSGGVSNFFDNYFIVDNVNNRIVCTYNDLSVSYRSPIEAKAFKDVFSNSTCKLIEKHS